MKTEIIYEDKSMFVCRKPAGLAVQTAVSFQEDVVSELKNYLNVRTREKNPYLGLIHRLDQPVEGLLVVAKTKNAAAALNEQLTEGSLQKSYVAVLDGIPDQKQGMLIDHLKKDGKTNRSYVVSEKEPEAKRAQLAYRILAESETEDGRACALAEIQIESGRHHQIRVQMSHLGYPLAGDAKYGSRIGGQLALCAYQLECRHPLSGKRLHFTVRPENPAFAEFLAYLPEP